MNKPNSGHKLSEINKKGHLDLKKMEKSGRPIRNKDFGHMTNNTNKNSPENEKGWSCQVKSQQQN